jgi:hypothetical protein
MRSADGSNRLFRKQGIGQPIEAGFITRDILSRDSKGGTRENSVDREMAGQTERGPRYNMKSAAGCMTDRDNSNYWPNQNPKNAGFLNNLKKFSTQGGPYSNPNGPGSEETLNLKLLSKFEKEFSELTCAGDYLQDYKIEIKNYINTSPNKAFQHVVRDMNKNIYCMHRINDQLKSQKPGFAFLIEIMATKINTGLMGLLGHLQKNISSCEQEQDTLLRQLQESCTKLEKRNADLTYKYRLQCDLFNGAYVQISSYERDTKE